jgi:hypothetical protein
VITIQTVAGPGKRTTTHTIVVANGRARATNELDSWRLFDLAKNNVTYVDDLARTWRTEPLESAFAARRAALDAPPPDNQPRATFETTAAKKVLQGVQAVQSVEKLGGYRRELWIGNHPLIPPTLFAAMQAARPAATPFAPLGQTADEALMNVRGFPLAEHAELPLDKAKYVVDSTVTKIEQREVPQSLLSVPVGYQELKPPPATAPAASRRRAS